jgi:hypothetical protein
MSFARSANGLKCRRAGMNPSGKIIGLMENHRVEEGNHRGSKLKDDHRIGRQNHRFQETLGATEREKEKVHELVGVIAHRNINDMATLDRKRGLDNQKKIAQLESEQSGRRTCR